MATRTLASRGVIQKSIDEMDFQDHRTEGLRAKIETQRKALKDFSNYYAY